MADESRSRLGRGLAALIGEAAVEDKSAAGRGQRRLPLDLLRPSPRNPRRHFGEGNLDELAASIAEKGILQPLLVRSIKGAEGFEIIAGERRWRAAQRAKLHDVPVIVLEVSDREAMEIAIIENIQRADLNPIEEANGYEQLRAQFEYSPQDLARVVGKSRSHIVNMTRLLKLPERVREHVTSGKLSAGHARALLTLPNPEAVAERVIDEGLTVRDVEALAQEKAAGEGREPQRRPRTERDADTVALENALREATGLDVRINHRDEAGEIRIRYRTLEQLDDVARRLRV
jgi:ParB family transcriptional regulator, chromosome partitioning protein